MSKKIENIFVTLEVAKMAKEKGFDEWCAAFWDCGVNGYFLFPNLNFNKSKEWGNAPSSYQCIAPTHFQLTQWLITNHKIYVFQESTERWKIAYDLACGRFGQNYRNTINEALLEALKLVNNE